MVDDWHRQQWLATLIGDMVKPYRMGITCMFLVVGFSSSRERHAANYARNFNIIFLVCHFVRVRDARRKLRNHRAEARSSNGSLFCLTLTYASANPEMRPPIAKVLPRESGAA